LPFAVLMQHWQGDFNVAQCIRNANGFGAKEVFYIGKKHYDRRGALGCYKYLDVHYFSSMEEILKLKEKYTFIGVDNIPGSVSMETFQWPENALLIFGEENAGLTAEMVDLCDTVVKIDMRCSVRSFNAGTASGIAMYDYSVKYNKRGKNEM
jgi:tRNA G18 (ribose-2'-O)-methylase SpoU